MGYPGKRVTMSNCKWPWGFFMEWKKCSDCGDSYTTSNTPKINEPSKKIKSVYKLYLDEVVKKEINFPCKIKFWVEKKVKTPPVFCFKWTRKNISLWKVEDRMICWEITEALPFSCGISFSSKFSAYIPFLVVLLLLCKLNESSSWFLKS